ncbi:DUF1877 family protein [Actinoplanes sp. TBRC 11911]|nr:DUF1877 family protein [Actinoplanes sp. TBRC 11911]
MSPELLEEVRGVPGEAYARIVEGVDAADRLDLEGTYAGLAVLMEAEHFAVNPITSGVPYPDDVARWGALEQSRSLTVAQVGEAAAALRNVPFEKLARHRYFLAAKEQRPRPYDEDALDSHLDELGRFYPGLVEFFGTAARNGQCTIFWTA